MIDILLISYRIFSIPMIVLHEISHIIAMLLTGIGFEKFVVEGKWFEIDENENPTVIVYSKTVKTRRVQFFVSYSQIIMFAIFVGLAFVSNFFLILSIYSIISIKATLPSKTDIDNYKNFYFNLYGDVFSENDLESI